MWKRQEFWKEKENAMCEEVKKIKRIRIQRIRRTCKLLGEISKYEYKT